MPRVRANGVNLHYEPTRPPGGPAIVVAHSISASMPMWDDEVAIEQPEIVNDCFLARANRRTNHAS